MFTEDLEWWVLFTKTDEQKVVNRNSEQADFMSCGAGIYLILSYLFVIARCIVACLMSETWLCGKKMHMNKFNGLNWWCSGFWCHVDYFEETYCFHKNLKSHNGWTSYFEVSRSVDHISLTTVRMHNTIPLTLTRGFVMVLMLLVTESPM